MVASARDNASSPAYGSRPFADALTTVARPRKSPVNSVSPTTTNARSERSASRTKAPSAAARRGEPLERILVRVVVEDLEAEHVGVGVGQTAVADVSEDVAGFDVLSAPHAHAVRVRVDRHVWPVLDHHGLPEPGDELDPHDVAREHGAERRAELGRKVDAGALALLARERLAVGA